MICYVLISIAFRLFYVVIVLKKPCTGKVHGFLVLFQVNTRFFNSFLLTILFSL